MPEDLDRDKMYSADADDDDGLEYELEPPDPDVLSAEKRRIDEVVASVKKSIDIDEVYRDFENRRDEDILRGWAENFRFRFQVKHMLIATAVLAILLTLGKFGLLVKFFVWAVIAGVIGVTLYLQWEEKKRQDAADRRRRQMYAERRAELAGQTIDSGGDDRAKAAAAPPLDEFDRRRQAASRALEFKFSLRQLMIVMTCAAVLLGLVNVLGGPQNAAMLLGFVALAGLAVHAFGYEPPEIVAFGWWVLILLYIVLSISTALWSGFFS